MDSTSIDAPVPGLVEAARRADVSGMRIGIVRELTGDGYQTGVQRRFDEAVAHLVDAGAEVVEVSCPSFRFALAAYYLVMPSEVSSNLARFDAMRYGLRILPQGLDDPTAEQVMAATRDAGFGDEVKRRIIPGTYALSSGYYDAYYGSAQKVRRLIADDFTAAFSRGPTSSSPRRRRRRHFRWGEARRSAVDVYAGHRDHSREPRGCPRLSLPVGSPMRDGLPAGFRSSRRRCATTGCMPWAPLSRPA